MSPEIFGDFLALYKTYQTITSFPLIYLSHLHKIPEKFLNLSSHATDSRYLYLKSFKTNESRNLRGDDLKDWKQVRSDVEDYNYLCAFGDLQNDDGGKWENISKVFDRKKEEWLKKEEFTDDLSDDVEDDGRYDSLSARLNAGVSRYSNRYIRIAILDIAVEKEAWGEYRYSDYYEEDW